MNKKKTPVGAYYGRPHKSIEELCNAALLRAIAGDKHREIVQDLVDGYGMGWQSENHHLIEMAATLGLPLGTVQAFGGV